ncbi:MAG: Flp pilus assembly protein CpaB [Deltaproteobacteria bacterium]|nr:Flp pilus assembly protein CpaB [Desulfitobacteriaceae bacterium]MDI6855090.1 Flp pilus assembly protein CpaB [Deltaproteobacteria bacterium]
MKLPPGIKYFILAGVVGLVATFLIHRYITTKTAIPVKPTDQVVVADLDIAPGTELAARMLKTNQWPRDIVPSKAVRNPKDVEGRVALVPISRGEPILQSKLAPEGTAAGLGGLLDPNKLAVTVRVDDVSGVAGFINPGDRVDLLVEMPAPEKGEHFSKILLQNLKVLSKGQIWDQTAEKKPQVVTTVTLEVTPEEAEIVNLATNQGKIRLALRNQLNQGQFFTKGVMSSQLAYRRPAPATPEAPAKAAEVNVEVIKGMQRSSAQL